MSKAERKNEGQGDSPPETAKLTGNDAQIARRVAALSKQEDREAVERLVADWREKKFFVDRSSDRGRTLTAKALEEADVVVAICLIRLGQIGVAEDAMGASARLCANLVAEADKINTPDMWLVLSSEGMPQAISDRLKLIDFLARAKGQAVAILDIAGVIRNVRA